MEIIITLTDDEYKVLADCFSSVEEWLQRAVNQNVMKNTQRIVTGEVERLINDPTVDMMSATEDVLLHSYFAQPDYKNAAQREANPLEAGEIVV